MSFYRIKSYAKINLALNITGKSLSLHKIESIIAFLSLHDDIFIKKIKSNKHKISFYGKFSSKIGKKNTVSKLLKVLEQKKLLNDNKFQIKIRKRIPLRAGLGGGSMNAANILGYFSKKGIIKAKKKELIEISRLVGSDVILGLNSKNSIINSKGEIKSFDNCKKLYTLVVKPDFGCSTKEIYSKVKKFNVSKFNRPSKKMFEVNYLKKMTNNLEQIVLIKYPKIKSLKFYIENILNPIFVRMTGSGSAIVAYFQSKKRCENAKKKFTKRYKNYWCMTSKTI